jgi:hypothetical protein
MNRQWHIRRQLLLHVDGRRRWDRAYQLLDAWAAARETTRCAPGGASARAGRKTTCGAGRFSQPHIW